MKVLIVEDESSAYDNLVEMIKEVDSDINIVGNTESVQQTIKWLKSNTSPDLLFMDIHLSDGSAFSIFDSMEVDIPVIFTTAYDRYAIDAFKVNSIDYLLKPIKQQELKQALNKYNRLSKTEASNYVELLRELSAKKEYKSRLLVPDKDKLIPIEIKDISFIYTTNKSTAIYLKDKKCHPINATLDQIFTCLNPEEFIRANKQFIVSRSSVKNITIWFDSRLLLNMDIDVPERIYVSKNKASEFKSWMVR